MNIIQAINNLSERTVLKMTLTVLVINTGCLVDAMYYIHKLEKNNKAWQDNHKYMAKINLGLNRIASNPKADPEENRAAIAKLLDDVNAEMLLDQVDFSGIEDILKGKDES